MARRARQSAFGINWPLVASRDLEIWVSSTSFQKINLADLNSLQQRVKKIIFDDAFHKNGLVLIIWVLEMIQPSGSVFFWWNEAVKVINATEVVEAVEDIEAVEVIEAAEVDISLRHLKIWWNIGRTRCPCGYLPVSRRVSIKPL